MISCRNLHWFEPKAEEKTAKVAVCPTCQMWCFMMGFDAASFEWPVGAPTNPSDGMRYIDWEMGCIMERKKGKWQVCK